MRIAVVAHKFPAAGVSGNVFIAKRMSELSKGDDPYGVRVARRDLVDWACRKLAVAALGRELGSRAAALFYRVTHPPFLSTRALVVDGVRSTIQVLVLRYVEDSEVPSIGKRSIGRIGRALRRRGCDIVHSHFLWYADLGVRIAAELNVPHVVTAHGSDVHETMRIDTEKRALFAHILEEAGASIFVSRALLEEAKSYGYTGKNAVVIHNGFDPAIFYPPEPGGDQRHGTRMLFVGNLLAVKGADRLPRIFSLVAEAVPGIRMDIVGGDSGEDLGETIRSEVAQSGNSGVVCLCGALDPSEIADIMRKSDLLLAPSRSEGFGCVAIEAQACGTPVLGTATGGLPEAIGDSEMIVEQGADFEAEFARKAVAVLLSRSRRVRPDIALLTWAATVRAERKVYEELVVRSRREKSHR